MASLFFVVLALAALYLSVLAYLALNQRQIVFRPDRGPPVLMDHPEELGLTEASVQTKDGLTLTGWFAPPKAGQPTIAYFHGNAGHFGNRVSRIAPYVQKGYGALLVGYRGYGGNPGAATEQGLYADARAYLDWLAGRGISGQQLVLFGESLGSAVALQMALERPALCLILEAPFASIYESAKSRYPWFAFDWILKDKFDNVGKIPGLKVPLMVAHGLLDRTTPVVFGRRVFAAAPEPKIGFWPEAANHNDLMEHGLPEQVLKFLDELRPPVRAAR